MKAMILAAGLGTRLRPLTVERPKVLIPVANLPLIDRTIQHLRTHGVNKIVINAHHHHQQILRYVARCRPSGVQIEVRVEPDILGTGGGIKNVSDFWDDNPFIVINGDILTDIDLTEAYTAHCGSGHLATLVLHHLPTFNKISIDARCQVTAIPSDAHLGEPNTLAFAGIHIIEPELLKHVPGDRFSDIIDCYRKLIHEGQYPLGHVAQGHYWRDVGTIESYVAANRERLRDEPFLLSSGCRVQDSARLRHWAVMGKNGVLEDGAEVSRSILWENVIVRKGARVMDSIVTDSKEVTSDLVDAIL